MEDLKTPDKSAADLWEKADRSTGEAERLTAKPLTYGKDVWRRFRARKSALVGMVLILFLLIFAILGPMLSSHNYYDQNLAYVNTPPVFTVYRIGDCNYYLTSSLKLLEVSPDGTLLDTVPKTSEDMAKKRILYTLDDGGSYYLDYSSAPARLTDAEGSTVQNTLTMRNKVFALGTDNLGRDLFTRLMYGARISLAVAFIAAVVNLLIGIIYGSISAYAGGMVDNIMMRIVDIINTIPLTLYVILIMVLLNNSGLTSIVIALGLVYWVNMARVVRGQILTLKQQEFVYASRTMGSSTAYIVLRHLIPNAMGPIIVTVTMLIPQAIFIEAFMSFIGLGVSAPMASWGTMCNDALESLRSSPYQLFFPALAICIAMFAFNFVGDGLRDALDPRMRK